MFSLRVCTDTMHKLLDKTLAILPLKIKLKILPLACGIGEAVQSSRLTSTAAHARLDTV